jgi:hypothetical protein
MHKCHDFYYTCQFDEYDNKCKVKVYSDNEQNNLLDSFIIDGEYGEDMFVEQAYLHIFDNEEHFQKLMNEQ